MNGFVLYREVLMRTTLTIILTPLVLAACTGIEYTETAFFTASAPTPYDRGVDIEGSVIDALTGKPAGSDWCVALVRDGFDASADSLLQRPRIWCFAEE